MSPLDELQLWCQVAGINKGKVYGLGSESTKAIKKHLYQESSSSSVHAMRDEIEQLKSQLKAVQTERDDMQQRMLNNEREIQQNNKMLQMLMHKMDVQPSIWTTIHFVENFISFLDEHWIFVKLLALSLHDGFNLDMKIYSNVMLFNFTL